jgi:Homeodomain-like domain
LILLSGMSPARSRRIVMKKYIVRLDAEERTRLEHLVRVGKGAAYRIRHANILLALDESEAGAKLKDADAARAFDVSVRSIESLRKRLVEEGLDAALDRKKQVRPSIENMFDGEKEARLIAIACGPKPEGRARWTLELLADQVVALKIVEHCSPQTVMRVLKKTS